MTETIPALLRAAAERWPDRPAVVDGETTLTFADLRELVRETAAGYRALGLQPGEHVCIWAPNSWQWEVAGLAVSYAGGVLVPLNTRYTGHEVIDVVARTSPRVVILADGFLGRSQRAELEAAAADDGVTLPTLVDIETLPSAATSDIDATDIDTADIDTADIDTVAAAVRPDDVADVLFTSGTTGRSKGAMSAHRQSLRAAQIWGELGEVTEADRYLVVNPFFHSFGYKAGILVSLTYGATLYPLAVYDPSTVLGLIQDQRITVLPGAPTIFQTILDAPDRASYDLSSLRFAVTGAAMVPVVLVERMQHELGFDLVLTAFGMTECVVGAMGRRGDPPELVATTTGRVVPGLELRIDAAAGEDGELLLRGDQVMLGYLDDPVATAEAIDPDGWLHTGDVGRVDTDGNLKITDRLKDVFTVGGFNVYPAEIEQALTRLDGVADAAVIGVPDPRLGEVGKAFVVRRANSELTTDDVIAYCRERVANFKVPRTVEFVDALPRNLGGKVLKTELRAATSPPDEPDETE